MCLLAIMHRILPGAPVAVAANRDERHGRRTLVPHVQPGDPRVLCGVDLEAGGTWLGVNEHGVLVAVTNRPVPEAPADARSRGLLCRSTLGARTAADALDRAAGDLAGAPYAGVNVLCADRTTAAVLAATGQVRRLDLAPGLHLLTNGEPDDDDDPRQQRARELFAAAPVDTIAGFVERARGVCADAAIVVRGRRAGTVAGQVVVLPEDRREAVFLHADGPPDASPWHDLSPLLVDLLDE